MPFIIRQYYIPMFGSPEREATICQLTEECNALEAEGWQMHSQIALPGGREVLFTFSRPVDVSALTVTYGDLRDESEREVLRLAVEQMAEDRIVNGAGPWPHQPEKNRGGRPRKVPIEGSFDGS